jgi:hypothetical protein
MKYISYNWSDIPEFVVPIMASLVDVAAKKKASEPRVPCGYVELVTFILLRFHKWPQMSVCHNHNPVLSLFMTYHNKNNKTSGTWGAETVYTWVHALFLIGFVLLDLYFSVD